MWPNNTDNYTTFCCGERELKNPGASPGLRSAFKPGTDFGAGLSSRSCCSLNHALINKYTKQRKKQKSEMVSGTIYSILSIPRPFKEVVWGLGKLVEISVCALMLIRHPWRCLSVCREDNVGFFYPSLPPFLRLCFLTLSPLCRIVCDL